MPTKEVKRMQKELREAAETIAQNQRDLDRYQDQGADYERALTENRSLKITLNLHQDYISMLLEFLRDAKALPEGTNSIIAEFDDRRGRWATRSIIAEFDDRRGRWATRNK